jgi:glycosyltransferase involved in cell wall biosynthesis
MYPTRIKLLQFLTLFGPGGTETQFVNLVRGLDPLQYELHVGCSVRAGPGLREIEALRLPVTEYRINRLYNARALKNQLRLARDIRRNGIHIVHAYNFYGNVFAIPAARLAAAPVIVASIRDTGDPWTPMQRRVQKLVCRLADCILTNAEFIRRSLIAEGYNPAKIEVIRNGVDLSRFGGTDKADSGSRLRQVLGLPSHVPLVVLLSRLNRLKGVEYFLRAAAITAERIPEARFVIVGDGVLVANGSIRPDTAYRSELERYAARLGLGERVVFTGARQDVPSVLAEAAVSALPSLSEGLSNVLLESMAAGAPVVATTVGGNPEVIEDGVTGLLVPPRDVAALARGICLLLENRMLAARLGEAGRQRVAQHFSLARMVGESERLYMRLLEQTKASPRAAQPA